MKTAIINLSAKKPVLPDFPACGICILESRHASGFEMPVSRYDFAEVMLILEGNGWVIHGRIRHPVQKDDLVIVPAGSSYHFEDDSSAPLAMFSLCIQPPKKWHELFDSLLPPRFHVLRNPGLSREISMHLRAVLYEQSQEENCNPSVVVAHALLLLAKVSRRQNLRPSTSDKNAKSHEIELLAHVRDYIRNLEHNFHESETIEAVADRLHISPRSLTFYFRKIAGRSRLQHIQKLRLDHACRLLSETGQSITSIAFACGFEDLSNFFRVFRAHTRQSPHQWRLRHRK